MRAIGPVSFLGLLFLSSGFLHGTPDPEWQGLLPAVPRGASVHHREAAGFDAYRVVAGAVEEGAITGVLEVQGRVSRTLHKGAETSSALEIYSFYRHWLDSQGFETVFDCGKQDGGSNFVKRWYALNSFQSDYGFNNSAPLVGGDFRHYLLAHKRGEPGDTYITLVITHGWWKFPVFRLDVVEQRSFDYQAPEAKPSQTEGLEESLAKRGAGVIPGLLFEPDGAVSMAESESAIRQVVKLLEARRGERFYVVGHSEEAGNLEAAQSVSERRAQTLVERLIAAGIEPGRLVARGVGPLAPLACNASEEGRARNRRVELVRIPPEARAAPVSGEGAQPARFPMPLVAGEPLQAARALLSELGMRHIVERAETTTPVTPQSGGQVEGIPDFEIKLKALLEARASRSGPTGPVIVVKTQSPAAGTLVDAETTVTLTTIPVAASPPVVSGPVPRQEKKLIPVPNVIGRWATPASKALKGAGFVPVLSGRNIGIVRGQSPRAGTMAEPGTRIKLQIGN